MANAFGIEYNKTMGFAIDGVAIPDPASYGYSSQSLDTFAERDTTGLLHRKMVDTKYNVALSWEALDYATVQDIIQRVTQPEFQFTFPCPEVPISDGGLHTGRYYVGDRKCDFVWANGTDQNYWVASLQFDLIEY